MNRKLKFICLFILLFWNVGCQEDTPTPLPTETAISAITEQTETATEQTETATEQAETATEQAEIILPTATNNPTATSSPLPLPSSLPSPTVPAAPTQTSSSVTPEPEKVRLVIGGLHHPNDVVWFRKQQTDPLAYLLGQTLHRSLLDPLTAQPQVASAWDMRGNRVTFTLDPDATWSDGVPIQASEILSILRQATDADELFGIEEMESTDSQTITATLREPSCPALMRMATWPLVEVQEWPPVRVSSERQVIPKDNNSWLIGAEGFEYRFYPDELALRNAWEKEEINSILSASELTMGRLPNADANTTLQSPLLATLLFSLEDPLITDDKIRQALTLATNRQALYETAYGNSPEALLTALLPINHWATPPESTMLYDPDEANALLTDAGWGEQNKEGVRINSEGEPLALTLVLPLSDDRRWEMIGKELVRQWSTINIDLTPIYLEARSLEQRLHDQSWQVALVAYLVSPEPDQKAMWSPPAPDDLFGQDLNLTAYDNSSVSDLFTRASQLANCVPEKRAPLYHRAWNQLLTDRPIWPLFHLPLDEVHQSDVQWPDVLEE